MSPGDEENPSSRNTGSSLPSRAAQQKLLGGEDTELPGKECSGHSCVCLGKMGDKEEEGKSQGPLPESRVEEPPAEGLTVGLLSVSFFC